jgi:hypothetical protein
VRFIAAILGEGNIYTRLLRGGGMFNFRVKRELGLISRIGSRYLDF